MACSTAFAIVPDHVIQKFGTEWASPAHIVSNGSFILKEWKVGEKIVLDKNRKYWDSAKTGLKRITFLVTDDANVGYKLYTVGAADWTDSIPADSLAEARQRPDFHENALYGTCFYVFNMKVKALDNVKIRKALVMAIDKGSLVSLARFP
jgi:oligopeptide transport system substrate-binding protein